MTRIEEDFILNEIKNDLQTCSDKNFRACVGMIVEKIGEQQRQIDDLITNYYKIANMLEQLGLAKLHRVETTKE